VKADTQPELHLAEDFFRDDIERQNGRSMAVFRECYEQLNFCLRGSDLRIRVSTLMVNCFSNEKVLGRIDFCSTPVEEEECNGCAPWLRG
jgi:hypothetical protein